MCIVKITFHNQLLLAEFLYFSISFVSKYLYSFSLADSVRDMLYIYNGFYYDFIY